ncbi:hypothetical protein [Mucilaginibacter sp.]|uniref:hypothetical protein n=1 Tax=Mucilaginibacter sp. TaxID=1882438 RepID=UPI0026029C40|nr:hypothetical protein [Mucilaginibacter sp.]MDB5129796.1 restriction endonuclease [Mucilaginibacter sp.]
MLLSKPDDQARALQKIFTELGWDADPQFIRQRIHELDNGLVQEDEFIFILNWLKNVELIHKLEQFQIPVTAKKDFSVPDVLVVVNINGQKKPYYIEIKTSKEDALSWSEKYYNGFKKYSEITGIPVLVAWKWKKFDIWALFRLEDMQQLQPGRNYKIDLGTAHKRNLMSEFFRDYFISLPDKTSFVIRHKKEKMTPTADGELWDTTIDAAYWTDRDGNEVYVHNHGIMALFFCLQVQESIEQDEKYLYYTVTPAPNKNIFAQAIPIMLNEAFAEKRINWLEKIQQQENFIGYDDLLSDFNNAFKEGTLNYIFFSKPNYG